MKEHQQAVQVRATAQPGTMVGAGELGPGAVGDMGMGRPIPQLDPLGRLGMGLDQALAPDLAQAQDQGGDMDPKVELLDMGLARADHMARQEVMEAPHQLRKCGDQRNHLLPAMPLSLL